MAQERAESTKIHFTKDGLKIVFRHYSTVTEQDIADQKEFFQHRFSKRVGKEISLKDIVVRASVGDRQLGVTHWLVRKGQLPYMGLAVIHQDDQNVLPNVLEDLLQYRENHKLLPSRALLLWQAVNGLSGIISLEEERQ